MYRVSPPCSPSLLDWFAAHTEARGTVLSEGVSFPAMMIMMVMVMMTVMAVMSIGVRELRFWCGGCKRDCGFYLRVGESVG